MRFSLDWEREWHPSSYERDLEKAMEKYREGKMPPWFVQVILWTPCEVLVVLTDVSRMPAGSLAVEERDEGIVMLLQNEEKDPWSQIPLRRSESLWEHLSKPLTDNLVKEIGVSNRTSLMISPISGKFVPPQIENTGWRGFSISMSMKEEASLESANEMAEKIVRTMTRQGPTFEIVMENEKEWDKGMSALISEWYSERECVLLKNDSKSGANKAGRRKL